MRRATGRENSLEPSMTSLAISSRNTKREGSLTPEQNASLPDIASDSLPMEFNMTGNFRGRGRASSSSLPRATRRGRPTASDVTSRQGRRGIGAASSSNVGRKQRIPSASVHAGYHETSLGPPRNASNKPLTNASKAVSKRGKAKQRDVSLPLLMDGNMAANPGSHYTIKPVIPAQSAELLSVARAMNREEFAPRLKKLFDPEREAALEAIESGLYVGWRCPEYKHDCIRVGSKSKCFCGHPLLSHGKKSKHLNHVCKVGNCNCKAFAFIPSRPEEVGEWWLPKRPGFDVNKWRAKCRCKHTHEEHSPCGRRQCSVKGCTCFAFDSNFLCCACDRHWEEHQTFFDTTDQRRLGGLPYGEECLPFYEMPDLRNIVLTGNEIDSSQYDSITSGPYAIPRIEPTPLSKQLNYSLQR